MLRTDIFMLFPREIAVNSRKVLIEEEDGFECSYWNLLAEFDLLSFILRRYYLKIDQFIDKLVFTLVFVTRIFLFLIQE